MGILTAGGILILTASALLPSRLWSGHHEVWQVMSTGLIGSGLAHFCTEWGKKYVGYLRPNFYAACGFDEVLHACTHENLDHRLSFPSGHASSSMAVGAIMCVYFLRARRLAAATTRCDSVPAAAAARAGALRLSASDAAATAAATHSRTRNDGAGVDGRAGTDAFGARPAERLVDFLLGLAALLPVGVAFWIALTRVHDNKHHPADVVAGAVLGAGSAIFASAVCLPADPVGGSASLTSGGAQGGNDGGRWL